MKIELLDEVDSTNNYIKRYLAKGQNVIVCARRQTGGKGTKGRSFSSEEGGVYLTALLFHEHLPATQAFRVMAHAAVSVCRAAESFGLSPQIKWANDVFLHGRKLCGILIENGLRGEEIAYSIVGIGVNACNRLTGLEDVAISLSEAAGRTVSVEDARRALIDAFLRKDTFEDYLARVGFLGKTVTVTEGAEVYRATALNILPDGRLEIERAGLRRALSAAEISLKIDGVK